MLQPLLSISNFLVVRPTLKLAGGAMILILQSLGRVDKLKPGTHREINCFLVRFGLQGFVNNKE